MLNQAVEGFAIAIVEVVGTIHLAATLLVDLKPEQVYRFWRIPENLPRFMGCLDSATAVDPWRSLWVVRSSETVLATWYVEVVADTEPVLIAWRSMGIEELVPDYSCQVRFSAGVVEQGTVEQGTTVHIETMLRLGSAAAQVLGDSPVQQFTADLDRFAGLMAEGHLG